MSELLCSRSLARCLARARAQENPSGTGGSQQRHSVLESWWKRGGDVLGEGPKRSPPSGGKRQSRVPPEGGGALRRARHAGASRGPGLPSSTAYPSGEGDGEDDRNARCPEHQALSRLTVVSGGGGRSGDGWGRCPLGAVSAPCSSWSMTEPAGRAGGRADRYPSCPQSICTAHSLPRKGGNCVFTA